MTDAIARVFVQTDEIDDNQARQLTFDLETMYTTFFRWLQEKGGGK